MADDACEISVLATGFGPFLSHTDNPSWEVAKAFAGALGEDFACRAERLDVSFDIAREFTRRVFSRADDARVSAPDLIVHFGLAASSKSLKFEGFAYNRRGKTSDSADAGVRKSLDGILIEEGRENYQTGVDVARLTELFAESGAPVCGLDACVSQDPGDYVCNAIYYHSLRAAAQARAHGVQTQVLFVHVPALEAVEASRLGAEVAACFRRYLAEGDARV
ncbi:hypothetical protein [Bradymonas sediminis]|uniref:Uncharacterized protein n=1 Tax=Bradymonas sediminis TaxID=1548548 RepID=A0A2Z4FPQ5_9DELT|nr:hypothetical protein [Bradymonas sediminis]AWV90735.1 hypothetical protein DN745_16000 [Bradymonas sediminis]TDP62623.1 pyroglutamyl-peptidase I [Bradymonas sediminis]